MGISTDMKYEILITFVITTMFLGCNRENVIEKELKMLRDKPIEFCTDSLMAIIGDNSSVTKSPNYMILTFLDSTECTVCQIRHMYSWEYLCNQYPMIPFVFIFESEEEKIHTLLSEEHMVDFSNVFLYCDTIGYFRRHNVNVPNNRLLHTLLLDSNRNVVISGNPTYNSKIKELIENFIKDEGVTSK